VEESSILVRILTFDGAMGRYPKTFGIGIATVKTAAADILIQKYIEKREDLDWKRVGFFGAFGFFYLGVFQYWMYVGLFSRFFKNAEAFSKLTFRQKMTNVPGLIDLGKQVVVDCFIHAPFIFFPSYYIAKEAIQGKKNALEEPIEVVTNAMSKYYNNCVEDWFAMWKIWIPGDIFVFALPLYARLPANHGISFIYVCILSYMRGAEE
jgi:hypothetical protein